MQNGPPKKNIAILQSNDSFARAPNSKRENLPQLDENSHQRRDGGGSIDSYINL